MKSKIEIVIVDDDIQLARLIQNQINTIDKFCCTYLFSNVNDLLNASKIQADIILLDLSMPGMDGMTAIVPIMNKMPNVKIIVNSIKNDIDTVFQALRRGAIGYIDKNNFTHDFEDILNTIAIGGAYMTPSIARKICDYFNKTNSLLLKLTKRELDIAEGILDGLSYKLIAVRYNISIDTVRMYIRTIYKKLKINSKSELMKLAHITKERQGM